jgi:hypothetical protein
MIKARCFTDDGAFDVTFDATPWFKRASASGIFAAAKENWSGGYGCDRIAMDLPKKPANLKKLFQYVDLLKDSPKSTGFECYVNAGDVLIWMHKNRPRIHKALLLKTF